MNTIAWRITLPIYVDSAFNGEGAFKFGGRWNHKGTPMVYTSYSKPLAALEMLAHINSLQAVDQYVFIPIEIESNLILTLDSIDLPNNWMCFPAPKSTKDIGDDWASSQKSLALEVPSVIFPDESNLLINPLHQDIPKLKKGTPENFKFDSRLYNKL